MTITIKRRMDNNLEKKTYKKEFFFDKRITKTQQQLVPAFLDLIDKYLEFHHQM
jgi:hypothetical protein